MLGGAVRANGGVLAGNGERRKGAGLKDKIINKHESYIYDGLAKLVTYDLKVGAGPEDAFKIAYMFENGYSYADGWEAGWNACCRMLGDVSDILQDLGKKRLENIRHIQESVQDNPQW